MSSITLTPKGSMNTALMKPLTAKTVNIPAASFSGQTIIITGSNTGIGLECAKLLLKMNVSRLILGVRSVKKGNDVITSLPKKGPAITEA